ncbi:DUF397 domain-containing protein [Nonomuraea spiralis]|nr:DUF397 domain-containing protein [Nonomuraea spiralis]
MTWLSRRVLKAWPIFSWLPSLVETNETGEVVRPMSGLTVSPDGWRKSSLSAAAGECVEFARSATGDVLLRDSKDPRGPVLTFTPGEWRAFIGGVRNAEFEV